MYEKIMVPLDGSKLAECVLPHVASIAHGCEVKSVTFVRVVEPFRLVRGGTEPSFFDEEYIKKWEADSKEAAKSYLDKLISKVNYQAKGEVLFGRPADMLADYAKKNDPDLIIVATHGRSGVSRWAWGSVTDKVLRSACVPVLMVRAPGCIPGI